LWETARVPGIGFSPLPDGGRMHIETTLADFPTLVRD